MLIKMSVPFNQIRKHVLVTKILGKLLACYQNNLNRFKQMTKKIS